jgi:hypothetical protein
MLRGPLFKIYRVRVQYKFKLFESAKNLKKF